MRLSYKKETYLLIISVVLIIKSTLEFSGGSLIPLGIVAMIYLTYIFRCKRQWLRGLFIGKEVKHFSKYQLIFGIILRTFLLFIFYSIVLNKGLDLEFREKLYGWSPEKNGILITCIVVLVLKIFESILSIGLIFKRLLDIHGFTIAMIVTLLILIFYRGINIVIAIPIIYVFFQQYLFYKTGDLRMTIISKIFTGLVYLMSHYLYLNNKDESWTLVVFFISVILEFIVLNWVYNKVILNREVEGNELV